MTDDRPTNVPPARLPRRLVEWLTAPFARFLRIETTAGAVLLLATATSLVLSNSPWASRWSETWETPVGLRLGSLEFARSIREWINDGLMTLFFFLVALELKRELVLGELRHPRLAALSIAAALGGMVIPAGLYLLLQSGRPGAAGWGVAMATDTAFVIGCLALIGKRAPQSLRVFLISLAIVDDLGAVLVVAVGYSDRLEWLPLTGAVLGVLAVRAMARIGVRSVPGYAAVGAGVWLAVDASGVHATVTGVVLGLMAPARRWVSDTRLYAILDQVVSHPAGDHGSGDTPDRGTLQVAETAARESLSPVERLQFVLHPWVAFVVMPLFALANAGLPLAWDEFGAPVMLAVFIGFVVGKPVGILVFAWLAVRSGLARRPLDLGWGQLVGGALLAGIGFTMALFIAGLAFDEARVDSAKMGIFLASAWSAAAGLVVLGCLPVRGRPSTRGVGATGGGHERLPSE